MVPGWFQVVFVASRPLCLARLGVADIFGILRLTFIWCFACQLLFRFALNFTTFTTFVHLGLYYLIYPPLHERQMTRAWLAHSPGRVQLGHADDHRRGVRGRH